MKTVDVVVVGASFAGLVFARTAALAGLEVLVLERRFSASTQLRTTGLLVKEAAQALDIPSQFTRSIPGVRLYSPSMRSIDLRSPGYYFLATDTGGLLTWLADEAERAGAKIAYSRPFRSASRSACGEFIHLEDGAVRTRYLVGADGARSRVARCFKLGVHQQFLTGVEAEFATNEALDQKHLHVLVDSKLAPGYIAWAVPGHGITQVGVACMYPKRPNWRGVLERFASVVDFRHEETVGWRAGLIPVGGRSQPMASPGVLLIGDAAGWVSPLTGGGICNAFRYARLAAIAVSDFLAAKGPEPSRALAAHLPTYPLKLGLRHLANLAPPNLLLDLALLSSPMRAIAQSLFFHTRAGAAPEKTGRPPWFRACQGERRGRT